MTAQKLLCGPSVGATPWADLFGTYCGIPLRGTLTDRIAILSPVLMGCYLLHFERPVFGAAQHYVGWAVDIDRRLREHLNGQGSRFVRQALRCGVTIELLRVWPDATRRDELRLKRSGPKRWCPKCAVESSTTPVSRTLPS